MRDIVHFETREFPSLLPGAEGCHEMLTMPDGVQLSAGRLTFGNPAEWSSASPEGISFGCVEGQLDFELGGTWRHEIRGAFSFALAAGEPIESVHRADEQARLRSVFLHVPVSALDGLMPAARGKLSLLDAATRSKGGPEFRKWKPQAGLVAVTRQILDCPYRGALRTLYLQAKALELLTVMLDGPDGPADRRDGGPACAPRDVENLRAAHDVLIGTLDSPPSLDALARHVGMSTSRLTRGFRALYGMSVVEFIQDRRLEHAYDALAEGRVSVAQAAYGVGYSPAYFSTLFRRRYGVPPSAIVRRR